MKVKKHSGELVDFIPESLKQSLRKSGASEAQVDQVYDRIASELYEGISTRELYQKAFNYLKKHRRVYAAKYSLKKALRDLGPAGFYFEKWVCSLMHYMGYETASSQTLRGHAVTHEIDVVAIRDDEFHIAECKLRNDVDAKIPVTTPMYFLSRLKDVTGLPYHYFGKERYVTKGWLVTNAYFTKDTVDFGTYYGINLLSWDYPEGRSIKNLTDEASLYPITCLTALSEMRKGHLLNNNIILVRDLLEQKTQLAHIIKNKEELQEVLKEAEEMVAFVR